MQNQPKPAIAGVDYQPASGSVTFTEDQSQANIRITILPNPDRKEWRWFYIKLSDPQGATLGQDTALGWIPPYEGSSQ